MRFHYGRLIRTENDLRLLVIDMQPTEEENESRKCRVAGDRLQPVV